MGDTPCRTGTPEVALPSAIRGVSALFMNCASCHRVAQVLLNALRMDASAPRAAPSTCDWHDDLDWGDAGREASTSDREAELDTLLDSRLPGAPVPHGAEEHPAFPHRVGPYELLLPIGTGATATVFLARRGTLNGATREVALKLFRPEVLRADPTLRSRAVREARLAGWIQHPNVVSVIDAGEEPRATYLVLDYVEGDTLSSFLRTLARSHRRIPTGVALRIAVDLLNGLHAVHGLREESGRRLDVVHRDVSPQNVLVGTHGVSRLIDLGVAKVPAWTQLTKKRHLLGKLPYVAPEQVAGLPLDRRCDVWSAGAIVWEMLAGRRLYHGGGLHSLVDRVSVPAPRLRAVRPDIAPELDHAVASALTPNPNDRCPTAHELRTRLENAYKRVGAIAEQAEVGVLLGDTVRPKLQERRAAVDALLEYRHAMSQVEEDALRNLVEDEPSTVNLAK